MPSYGGSGIFGTAVKMKTVVNPSADQINAFFGISGMESLFGGTRGRVTLVSGLLGGGNVGVLSSLEENFVSYNDGIARDLVDTRGYTFSNVRFQSFEPGDGIIQDAAGNFWRTYRASFSHLT